MPISPTAAGSKNPVQQRSPIDILKNNFATHIDTLFGMAYEEALFNIAEEMTHPALLEPINENFKMEFPIYSINHAFDFESEVMFLYHNQFVYYILIF